MFLKNAWYVAAWDNELPNDKPIGRTIIGEPIVLYRKENGTVAAMADRCAHRHAPLSLGRVEGNNLRCMYHGLIFDPTGTCIHVPGQDRVPPNIAIRRFPVYEQDSWIWVWMGDPEQADPAKIPKAWGLNNPDWVMTAGQLDYEASYDLINDNLTDLSHLDFVHETTLAQATGGSWSENRPKVTAVERGVHITRWFINIASPGLATDQVQDIHIAYYFMVPGIFIMRVDGFPAGTAEVCNYESPDLSLTLSSRVEQQAVTPIDDRHTRYLFASGMPSTTALSMPTIKEKMFSVVQAAFAEDRRIIEAQQRVRDVTSPETLMAAIPQDRGPLLMRSIMDRLIKAEND